MVGVKEANEYDYGRSDYFLDKIEPFIDPVTKQPIVERGKHMISKKRKRWRMAWTQNDRCVLWWISLKYYRCQRFPAI